MNTDNAPALGSRIPTSFTDEDGTPCLRVPLDDEGHDFALIERDDYLHITQTLGCKAKWCLGSNGNGRRYVVVNPPQIPARPHGLISVGRLVAEAGAGQTVRYATPNTLDLRRSNLTVTKGGGRSRRNCTTWLAENVQASNMAKAKRSAI